MGKNTSFSVTMQTLAGSPHTHTHTKHTYTRRERDMTIKLHANESENTRKSPAKDNKRKLVHFLFDASQPLCGNLNSRWKFRSTNWSTYLSRILIAFWINKKKFVFALANEYETRWIWEGTPVFSFPSLVCGWKFLEHMMSLTHIDNNSTHNLNSNLKHVKFNQYLNVG